MASRSRTKTGSTASDNPSQRSENGASPQRNPNRLSNLSQGSLASRSTGRSVPRSRSSRPTSEPVELKRRLGLISGIALIVGTMIGSGIFISPQGVAEGSGSVGLSLVVWTLCGLVSLCGSLSYAELGTMIGKSGGEYSYLLDAFASMHRVVGPIPAFLFSWTNTIVLRPAMVAIITLTFATYALEPFRDVCTISEGAQKCLAALCILILTVVNCLSVRLATVLQTVFTIAKLLAIVVIVIGGFVKLGQALLTAVNARSVPGAATVQVVFTAIKLIGLICVIIGGLFAVAQGYTQYLDTGFTDTETKAGKIAIAFYNGMWAYDGWNNLNYVTEELIRPHKYLPWSIMIGIPLVTVCYVLVNISYFTVLSIGELVDTPAVAITWGNRVLGPMSWLIPISVALSTFGATNGTLFSTGRLTYVAAREGHMVEVLSMVHVRKFTPLPSLVFTSLLALLFIIPGDISSLIEFFNFAVWFFYGGTMAALLVLRYTNAHAERPYKVPIVLPIFVLLVSVYLVVAPIIDNPRVEFLYAFLFIVGGLLFYFPFVYFQKYPIFMDRVTEFFQLLLEVSPPMVDDVLPGESFT